MLPEINWTEKVKQARKRLSPLFHLSAVAKKPSITMCIEGQSPCSAAKTDYLATSSPLYGVFYYDFGVRVSTAYVHA